MTRTVATLLAACLLTTAPASARMGDTLAQTVARYGQPGAATGQPGQLTSTRTFAVDGLQVTCGYVAGQVEMETISRTDRDFLPAEVEAFIRTNSQGRSWTPAGPYTDGTFQRADGISATVAGNKIAFQSPKWLDALAKDADADKAALAKLNANATNSP
jgi:hypothetical protein